MSGVKWPGPVREVRAGQQGELERKDDPGRGRNRDTHQLLESVLKLEAALLEEGRGTPRPSSRPRHRLTHVDDATRSDKHYEWS